jgi:hypothetical protein
MSSERPTGTKRIAVLTAAGLVAVGMLTGLLIAARDGGSAAGTRSSAGPCGASSSRKVTQPTPAQLRAAGLGKLTIASSRRRVDLVAPPFSNPTAVTNPLFPIARLQSAILNGQVDGKRFRTETTLLPQAMIMEWIDRQCVEVLVSQYLAFSDGRIEEVALDRYAQDDEGSVWYLGEDVFNYKDGVIAETSGTWHAGHEGPAAMIMPARPQVGDVYRPENIAGLVFEEVTVKAVEETVDGPHGPVRGAITVEELHDDGSHERKLFAPGYGEFFTGSGGDVEALALAVPTDARSGPEPWAVASFTAGAGRAYELALTRNWKAAGARVRQMTKAWRAYRLTGSVPKRLAEPTRTALSALTRAVEGRKPIGAALAAIRAAEAGLDLELQYRPVAEIDRDRFELWLRHVVADARGGDTAAVTGDVATLEWIRDRIVLGLDKVEVTRIDTLLRELRSNAGDAELDAASETAVSLRRVVDKLG